ncbi:hypothetical protein HID58_089982 [Brassica napus]|uniref:Dolichyl-diphosphooligosaccharide--protein glycosyltransferase subunit 4 n=5 Tax=Brassica TaxID=3705 RepID=A0ABQ7Y0P0_BRANA|nr:hypothetical protein HID58_089982 [Brassica napus]CDY10444.1 BnaCnng03450D [Brassica napus]VDD34817.1 unnamed protein product [Brassica oleracea]
MKKKKPAHQNHHCSYLKEEETQFPLRSRSKLLEKDASVQGNECVKYIAAITNLIQDNQDRMVMVFFFVQNQTMTRPKEPEFVTSQRALMFEDQDLGFFANFLGIFIFILVIAYHFVVADPKFE